MSLAAKTYQFLTQLPLIREIDASLGPAGPQGAISHWLVPASGWHNSQRFPHAILEDLQNADHKFEKVVREGIEYFKVPEESTNLPGLLSHYAQKTGVAELRNPPGGGANRVVETLEKTADATVAPDAVKKYVDEVDPYEEARKKVSEEDARVQRQVTASPAREPGDGKLEVVEQSSAPAPAEKKAPAKSADKA